MDFNHVTLTADLLADEEYGPRWHAAATLIDAAGGRHDGTAAAPALRVALLGAVQVAQGGEDIWHERTIGVVPKSDPSAAIKAAQDTLATITGQANGASGQAAGEVPTEQKLQDQATAASEEASVEFAGSGSTVNMYGISMKDATAVSNEVSWEARAAALANKHPNPKFPKRELAAWVRHKFRAVLRRK